MRYFVTGGAGFVGSHLVHKLLETRTAEVTVYDNFSSGRHWHLEDLRSDSRLNVVTADLKDLPRLTSALNGHEHVFHLASNPDIAKAVTQPDIDFWAGTYLTQNVLEAMRLCGVRFLTYTSGSGVYGDIGEQPASEDYAPLLPISTYGASKLAGEVLISAYSHMFGVRAQVFRFANVVGPHQTHGVTFDFIRRLLKEPQHLTILGDGNQSKSYISVDDVIAVMLWIPPDAWKGFEYFNAATEDYVTVRQIANLVVRQLGLTGVRYEFAGGDRGWKGDVPVVRFDSSKLRKLGWKNQRTSRQALSDSIDSMIADARAGRLQDGA